MEEKRIMEIAKRMEEKSSQELLDIWNKNDRDEWTEEALEAVKKTLSSRGMQVTVRHDTFKKADRALSPESGPGNNSWSEVLFNNHEPCWWCGKQPAIEDSSFPIKMWRNVKKRYMGATMDLKTYQINWEALTILVPRCPSCEQAHDIFDHYSRINRWTAGIGTAVVLIGLMIMAFNQSPTLDLIRGALIFTTLGVVVTVYFINETRCSKIGKGIHKASHGLKYPEVLKRRKERWQLGDKPPLDSAYIQEEK